MILKNITLLTALLISSSALYSQAQVSDGGGVIYINKNTAGEPTLDGKRGGYFGSHPLGDSIQVMYDKFLKMYVEYQSTGGAYASEKKIIHKEEIYNSIGNFDKYFKKMVRKDEISQSEAVRRYYLILSSAISIRYYDTSEFENILKATRDIEQKEKYFNNLTIR